jgi:hypothetical protein
LGKWVTIRENIGRKTTKDNWDGMIMGSMGRGDSFGVVKKVLVFREDKLYVRTKSK